jgi:hypothetical protein
MSGYTIIHTDQYDNETNKADGRVFRNKDEVIAYLCDSLAAISGDYVVVSKRGE